MFLRAIKSAWLRGIEPKREVVKGFIEIHNDGRLLHAHHDILILKEF